MTTNAIIIKDFFGNTVLSTTIDTEPFEIHVRGKLMKFDTILQFLDYIEVHEHTWTVETYPLSEGFTERTLPTIPEEIIYDLNSEPVTDDRVDKALLLNWFEELPLDEMQVLQRMHKFFFNEVEPLTSEEHDEIFSRIITSLN